MRSSIESVKHVLGSTKIPAKIWQRPYDRDAAHLYRLVQPGVKEPNLLDLVDYVLDFRYEEIQGDLFRYLIPNCFAIWSKYLLDEANSSYKGFVEQFSSALQERSVLEQVLDKQEYEAIVSFWCDTILDRIDQEKSLHFSGNNRVYNWFGAIGSFAVSLPRLPQLWQNWWEMKTQGQAIAVLQYISCLMYERNKNPIFTAWSQKHGGGPPILWETDGLTQVKGWKEENISFLKDTLTTTYIKIRLQKANTVLETNSVSNVGTRMLNDLPNQQDLLKLRLELLPDVLRNPQEVDGFSIF